MNAAWAKALPLAGGILTGPLTLSADPTTALGASTKQYDDKAIASAGVIGCTAVGTNSIALTPRDAVYAPTTYTDTAPLYTWVQTLTTNGAVTINISGLGAKNAYKQNGTPVGANDLIGGQLYQALYYSGLNAGAGGFVVAAAAIGRVTISDTAPSSPAVGDLWWDSVSALLYLYYQDPNSTQWVNANNAAAGGGGLVGFNSYSSSQTITIPANATKAMVEMWGGTGGTGGLVGSYQMTSGGSGAGGFLRKFLTGLTSGNTIIFTQGGAGAAGNASGTNGGNGGNSTLVSGSQTISTLTANGSPGTLGQSSPTTAGWDGAGGAGGTATGGDFNFTGRAGQQSNNSFTMEGSSYGDNSYPAYLGGMPGIAMYSTGTIGAGPFRGSPGIAGNAGSVGGCQIWWYS
jgi:hypothetical protein